MMPVISARSAPGEWTQDGAFAGSEGRLVRCYDDVVLLRSIAVSGGTAGRSVTMPAGTIGTVLFYSTGATPMAELEFRLEGHGIAFGQAGLMHLRLHQTNEQKYPR